MARKLPDKLVAEALLVVMVGGVDYFTVVFF
jgi:hypothetical protein